MTSTVLVIYTNQGALLRRLLDELQGLHACIDSSNAYKHTRNW